MTVKSQHTLIFILISFGLICIIIEKTRNLVVDVPSGTTFDAKQSVFPTKVLHSFALHNPNLYPVALSIPIVGCACTTASVSTDTIPPFGSATVNVKITPDDPGEISAGVCARVEHNGKQTDTWLFVKGTSVKSEKHVARKS